MLLVAALARPARHRDLRLPRRLAAHPRGAARRRTATGGANGAGDPYFPDYGSSGYDATQYTVAVDFDPGDETLTGRTVVAAQATEELASFYLDLALPATRVWVDDVDADLRPRGLPGSPGHPGHARSRTADASR